MQRQSLLFTDQNKCLGLATAWLPGAFGCEITLAKPQSLTGSEGKEKKMNPCSPAVMSEGSDFVAKKTRMQSGMDWDESIDRARHVHTRRVSKVWTHTIAGRWTFFTVYF